MTRFGFKAIAVILFVVWIGTMAYLWSPDMIPRLWDTKKKNVRHTAKQNGTSSVSALQRIKFPPNFDMKEAAHICITSDKNTIGGMVTLINSIHRNTNGPIMFHLTVDRESVEHISKWLEVPKLRDVMYEVKVFPEEWVKGKINVGTGRPELASPLNYARYYIPQLFPNLTGRIIFIDDDCIVQGDIHQLYNIKLKEGHIAAFSEDCSGTSKRLTRMKNNYADFIDLKNKHVKEMKIDANTCSFNTGLYVANLDLWRKNNITEKLQYWLELNTKEEVYGNERAGGGSQPPMLLVFYRNYTKIDPNWHVRFLGWTTGTSYTKQFIQQAKLLHWNGRFKPWGRQSQHLIVWDQYFIQDPTMKFHPVRRDKEEQKMKH